MILRNSPFLDWCTNYLCLGTIFIFLPYGPHNNSLALNQIPDLSLCYVCIAPIESQLKTPVGLQQLKFTKNKLFF